VLDQSSSLCDWAVKVCPEESRIWLEERLSAARQGRAEDVFLLFSAAGRRLGCSAASVTVSGIDASRWRAQDVGRVAALSTLLSVVPSQAHASLVEDLYFRGSTDERRAVLLFLPLAQAAQQWLDLAVEACRTNTLPLFESIACENTYPARYFGEAQFNQLVLKTMFLDLDVQRIAQLTARITPQLILDLDDFRREREAAGRDVPAGIFWILEKASS